MTTTNLPQKTAPEAVSPAEESPLCIDLDGTLVLTDTLWESVLVLLRNEPWRAPQLIAWALAGPAPFKREMARRVRLDPGALPYHPAVLERARAESERGRRVVLVTAAHESIATAVAAHLGIFSEVLATADGENLKGPAKAARLTAKFGARNFDYIGNDRADLPVWQAARRALAANARPALARRAEREFSAEVLPLERAQRFAIWRRALRVHQWAKNLLVLVPLFAAHRHEPLLILQAFIAAIAFSLCASSVYLINDLLDLPADRQHPRKRSRPLAAGSLSIPQGLAAVPLLLAGAAACCAFLPLVFTGVLAIYYLVTFAYSFVLKRKPLVDVICLAALYMSRLVAGGAAVQVPLSDWLLAFAVFLFFGLGMAKRLTELQEAALPDGVVKVKGRGYIGLDLPVVSQMGITSSYLSVLVLAFYVNSPAVASLYHRPYFLWGACVALLYWVSRVWLLANRRQLDDDPVVFALRDRVSHSVVGLLFITFLLAQPK